MSKVLIGRDATVYTFQNAGVDQINLDIIFGSVTNILGTYKSIEVEVSNEWVDTTPSSSGWKEKRRTVSDWTASLENLVRSGGSVFLGTGIAFDYAAVAFTDELNGLTVTLVGGIKVAKYHRDQGSASQSLTLEGTYIDGTPGITYA